MIEEKLKFEKTACDGTLLMLVTSRIILGEGRRKEMFERYSNIVICRSFTRLIFFVRQGGKKNITLAS